MFDDLLIVFANYNGYRSSHNVTTPRISLTIDSFRSHVPYWEELNVLLLDTNSQDDSHLLLESYASKNWKYHRKTEEHFYLGSLSRLVDQFETQYKYILVMDNDRFFFRPGFLETSLNIFRDHPDVVNVQLNEITWEDLFDKAGSRKGIVCISDFVGRTNNEIWMKACQCKQKSRWHHRRSPMRGGGVVKLPGASIERRACWMWWASGSNILKISAVKSIFERELMLPPFCRNQDRLALFAYYMNECGRTAWLARGANVNFGFRRKLSNDNFDLKKFLRSHPRRHSLILKDKYSFFVNKEMKLRPISYALSRLEKNGEGIFE